MNWRDWLALIGSVGFLVVAVRMIGQPTIYLRTGRFGAIDPRTVRQFGIGLLILGLGNLGLLIISIVSE